MKNVQLAFRGRRRTRLIIAFLGAWALLAAGCSSTTTHYDGAATVSTTTGLPVNDGLFHMRPCTVVK
ncbi:hypothetical protein [Cerasicoccus frondis]|uniref:hypothetical protein n=1 Tax=Cerasicoccus frondis TaxID=490090 RepID=UPI0028527155|nr:hypothetical protein [Cerasicoccus frondis]